jgi:hypothetical protein
MKRPTVEEPATSESEDTGLPWFRTWAGVYLFVLGFFALCVLFLTLLSRAFS